MYQNNSLVSLENIGENGHALRCMTDNPACCRLHSTNGTGRPVVGNWFFPNGTRVLSYDKQWDFHRKRGHRVVNLSRTRGGANGVYRCVVPDAMNVTQTIYIGVYTAGTGEWYIQCV